MSLRLFCCHIDYEAGEADLRNAFEKYGKVVSVYMGRSKNPGYVHGGWAFVEMENETDARQAAQDLEGQPLPGFENGRTQKLLHIEDARPQPQKSRDWGDR